MSIEFDLSELDRLTADLGKVVDNAGPLINSAMQVTAGKVRDAARDSVKGGARSWKALPNTIDYDKTVRHIFGVSQLQIDIGYNKDRGGAGDLGNLREYGAPAKGLAPHNDLQQAAHANEDDFAHGLDQALRDAERKAGL